MKFAVKKKFLEEIYDEYNQREFVHPDPLEFLYNYENAGDREVVALVASSLAYGRVTQILKSVSVVLARMGRSPRSFLVDSSKKVIEKNFESFRHRFTSGRELSRLFIGTKGVLLKYGSLYNCFMGGIKIDDSTIIPALSKFVFELGGGGGKLKGLLPEPCMGSACKRLNLFLRWMVRQDAVDPGGWNEVPTSKLVVPLDTHMHKIGFLLGFTKRKVADLRAALELTRAFAVFSPQDPVKYDFALTRLGIRRDMSERHKDLANLCRIS